VDAGARGAEFIVRAQKYLSYGWLRWMGWAVVMVESALIVM
jgi:hypothetical protein